MLRLILSATLCLLVVAPCSGVELPRLDSFDTRTPDVGFDVPERLVGRDVTTDAFAEAHPDRRLIEIETPVSLQLFRGEAGKIQDIVIEVDGSAADLSVYDYAPRTELQSEFAEPIEQKTTVATDRSIGASLGAEIATDVSLTPTISAGASKQETSTEVRSRLPPKQATVVSGTIGGRSGVYFKLRHSSQSTLEGERTFKVTFEAPASWSGGDIQVRCLARGEKRWLFVDQRRVWNETTRPVELRLVSHTAAKPEVRSNECACSE